VWLRVNSVINQTLTLYTVLFYDIIFKNKLKFSFGTTCLVLFIWCYVVLTILEILAIPWCGIYYNTPKNAHVRLVLHLNKMVLIRLKVSTILSDGRQSKSQHGNLVKKLRR
jgi:hypothetical protein